MGLFHFFASTHSRLNDTSHSHTHFKASSSSSWWQQKSALSKFSFLFEFSSSLRVVKNIKSIKTHLNAPCVPTRTLSRPHCRHLELCYVRTTRNERERELLHRECMQRNCFYVIFLLVFCQHMRAFFPTFIAWKLYGTDGWDVMAGKRQTKN